MENRSSGFLNRGAIVCGFWEYFLEFYLISVIYGCCFD